MKKLAITLFAVTMSVSSMSTAAFAASKAEVEAGVNMRTSPSTDSRVIRTLHKGEDIEVIEKLNNYWLRIQTEDGKTGYISANSKYTNYVEPEANESVNITENTIITKGSPYLRSAPSVSNSKVLRSIPKGTQLEVLSKPSDYYVKVNYNGQNGFISTKYIEYVIVPTTPNTSSPAAPTPAPEPAPKPAGLADAIIETAKSLIGQAEYNFGTRNHNKLILDCSSFTEYVFEKHGIELKWGTRYQKDAGEYVSKSDLQKGDLVFFTVGSGTEIGHVGIYISDGEFIHILDREDSDVHISNLTSGYWEDHYVTARRVIN